MSTLDGRFPLVRPQSQRLQKVIDNKLMCAIIVPRGINSIINRPEETVVGCKSLPGSVNDFQQWAVEFDSFHLQQEQK